MPAEALGRPASDGPAELNFVFRVADATLYNLDVYHLEGPAASLRPIFDRVSGEWRDALGAPTHDSTDGRPLPADTASAALDFRRADATYELTFVNLQGNVSLREHVIRPDLATP